MTDIVQIIGTRPQYIKLIRFENDYVIDTGQHYSEQLNYDKPDVDCRFNWAGKCVTGYRIMQHVKVLQPRVIVVYGDTFSTLIGALIAKILAIPLVHIEAGLMTFSGTIEDKIRMKVDSIADYLLCPTKKVTSVASKMYKGTCVFVGDLMYEKYLKNHVAQREDYVILTVHRRENLPKLGIILDEMVSLDKDVIFYAHPHTIKYIEDNGITIPPCVTVIEAIPWTEMQNELNYCKAVVTDSGGLIREAYWSGIPCRYLGDNPWPETEEFGFGDTSLRIKKLLKEILK